MRNFKIYTDGACTHKTPCEVSWAYVIIDEDDCIMEEGKGYASGFYESRNVSGEVHAVIESLKCIDTNWAEDIIFTIHYDYSGVEKWITEAWRANKGVSQWYKASFPKDKSKIKFKKVKAHSGDRWNEYVDAKAKEVLNINTR